MKNSRIIICLTALIATSLFNTSFAEDWKTLLNLRGTWKFELGDNPRWSDPAFNDAKWDNIRVPSPWEEQGYPGYDGYAWYRKHFTLDKKFRNAAIYLHVGYVDDASEVYLNGHMIGYQGTFPPKFITAYNIYSQFYVPQQFLNYDGENVVAVRVYDQRLAGGIISGRVGLFEPYDYLNPDYNLAGTWKFRTGDDMSWKDSETSDARWSDLIVPGFWETQGFKDYDGFGWYRIRFKVPQNLVGQRLILLVGKIDDVDETFLNGERIGRTGSIEKNTTGNNLGNDYTKLRAYVIPPELLVPNQTNIIAVRVLDVFMHGGIYDGPIGLVTREKYLRWQKEKNRSWNPFDWLE